MKAEAYSHSAAVAYICNEDLMSHLDAMLDNSLYVWVMRYETSFCVYTQSQGTLDFHTGHWPLTQYGHASLLHLV